jgi:hypothetical protein
MRSTIDTGRLGKAASFPGIDPRCWCCLAVVLDLGVDPETGVYADVSLIPSGDKQTCIIGSGYSGRQFGAWFPIQKDDLVVVLFPRGDPAEGPVVVSRLWSGSDPPPPELGLTDGVDPPTNPVIVVGEGQTVRVVCRPGATVEVVGDSPTSEADPVTLSTPNDSNWSRLAQVLALWTPVPLDGGAALKTLLTSMLGLTTPPGPPPAAPAVPAPFPEPTAATRLKGE